MESLKVLVADDEPEMVDLLIVCLSRAGHQVRGVGGAEELISCVATWCPDVVITDVQMPGGGGRRVLRYMEEEHAATPVLLMTGGEKIWAHQAVLQGRAAGVLDKPFSIRAMIETVAKLRRVGDHSPLLQRNGKAKHPTGPLT